MGFLDGYEPVEDRIRRFYKDHPAGRITTTILHHDERTFIVNAAIFREGEDVPAATGHAQEVVGSTNVNKLSALENCETSAIGRALANLNYAPKGARPSREEMSKVAEQEPKTVDGYDCPACGTSVLNNLSEHFANSKQPAFKCGNRTCQGGTAKKTGGGNWPWATWDADYFKKTTDDTTETPIREDYPAYDSSGYTDFGEDDPERPF
jgi:hypothetical protein